MTKNTIMALIGMFIIGTLIIFGLSLANANLCKIEVKQDDAIKQVTEIIKVPMMELKTQYQNIVNQTAYKLAMLKYQADYNNVYLQNVQVKSDNYLLLKSKQTPKSLLPYPIIPKTSNYLITISTTTQNQKTENKLIYYLNFSAFPKIIQTKTIKVPLYENKEVSTYKLNEGYTFNEDDGKFYFNEECK